MPENIVKVKICSKSGKLPREGICDAAGCVTTEYFAAGTEPTEYCTVHYEGEICAYDHKVACDECPFKYHGYVELPLIEDPALSKGSTMIVRTADGGQTLVAPSTTMYCQHNSLFFLKPGIEAILDEQRRTVEAQNAQVPQE